jgi:hypothetical protein
MNTILGMGINMGMGIVLRKRLSWKNLGINFKKVKLN